MTWDQFIGAVITLLANLGVLDMIKAVVVIAITIIVLRLLSRL
jgi:hypothetical protein